MAPLTGARQLSVGNFHACVTVEGGQARCWGVGEHGRIGDGTLIDRKRAVVVRNETGRGPLTGVRQVVAGGTHTCAVVAGGQVRCWGLNAAHQLGTQGPATQRVLPVVVRVGTGAHPPFTGAVSLGTAYNTTCAVLASGQVRCWGDDAQAELGNGPATGQIGPVAVRSPAGGIDPPPGPGNLTGITQVGGGGDHLCARRANGRAYCSGAPAVPGRSGSAPTRTRSIARPRCSERPDRPQSSGRPMGLGKGRIPERADRPGQRGEVGRQVVDGLDAAEPGDEPAPGQVVGGRLDVLVEGPALVGHRRGVDQEAPHDQPIDPVGPLLVGPVPTLLQDPPGKPEPRA